MLRPSYLNTNLLGVICDGQDRRIVFALLGLGVLRPGLVAFFLLLLGLCLPILLGSTVSLFGLGLLSLGLLGLGLLGLGVLSHDLISRLRNLRLSSLDVRSLVCHFCCGLLESFGGGDSRLF